MVDRDGMRRGSGGGCGWGGGMLGRWSLRRLLLDSPLVGRRLAHTGIYYFFNAPCRLMKIVSKSYLPRIDMSMSTSREISLAHNVKDRQREVTMQSWW